MATKVTDGKNRLLVQLDGNHYDVTDFAEKHPGGAKVLQKLAGEEIGKYFRGEERVMGVRHEHSEAALNMLERYNLNVTAKDDKLIASDGGILWKVGSLGSDYWTWIHKPFDGSLRLFESDFLESLTRTNWKMVPSVWIPVVILYSILAVSEFAKRQSPIISVVLWSVWFLIGLLTWTITEYSLHRWAFHWRPRADSPRQILLHFLIHGLHHKTPMDGDRLVFPPVPAALIVSVFYVIYSIFFPWPIFCAFGAGKLFGYVLYDMVHYYLHHGRPAPHTDMHFRKVYHHNHHFKNYDTGFGISTMFWDKVFNTVGLGPL